MNRVLFFFLYFEIACLQLKSFIYLLTIWWNLPKWRYLSLNFSLWKNCWSHSHFFHFFLSVNITNFIITIKFLYFGHKITHNIKLLPFKMSADSTVIFSFFILLWYYHYYIIIIALFNFLYRYCWNHLIFIHLFNKQTLYLLIPIFTLPSISLKLFFFPYFLSLYISVLNSG